MTARIGWDRRRFLRTLTTSLSLFPTTAFSVPPYKSRESGPVRRALLDSPAKMSARIFDPLLDPRCYQLPGAKVEVWPAHWIWYPGQLTAHLHARTLQASMGRCAQVGYPSSFRQPLSFVYFRKRAVLSEGSGIRWAGPLARIRFILNGAEADITVREKVVPAGPVEIVVRIDFARGLPCLLLDGGKANNVSTGENWEASLDFHQWVEAEGSSSFCSPDTLPDEEREVTIEIPVDQVVQSKQVTTTTEGFLLAAGSELVVDFRHDEVGQLAFDLEGQGELTTRVGESIPEVLDPDERYFEQRPIPPTPCAAQARTVLLPLRGLRYASLSANQPLVLKNLHFLARVTPVQYRGHFECSDPEVNEIWAAGAATIHSCLHGFYWDGIRRDGLPWDDGVISLEAADAVFY
ncbi:MAG TPA: hypothetical protein VMW38_09940, partial [Terriglobia bacterium]|nr:hypothetical protein [Terriglobia bacterium]